MYTQEGRQTDRQTNIQAGIYVGRQTDVHTGRQSDRQDKDKQASRLTGEMLQSSLILIANNAYQGYRTSNMAAVFLHCMLGEPLTASLCHPLYIRIFGATTTPLSSHTF